MKLVRWIYVFVFLAVGNVYVANAAEWTMKTNVLSQNPFIVKETYHIDAKQVAMRKITLDRGLGGDQVPQPKILEFLGEIPDGTFIENFPGGGAHFTKSYANGVKHGPSRELYENGKIKREVMYENGKKQGVMKEFYIDGTLQKTQIYVNNMHEGVTKNYSMDGLLESEMTYDRGATVWWKTRTYEYQDNGKLKSEYEYNQRTYEGYRKEYHPNGQLAKSFIIREGKLTDFNEYDDQGNLLTAQQGGFNGQLQSFYANGKLLQEDQYEDGVLIKFKMYDLDGNIIAQ